MKTVSPEILEQARHLFDVEDQTLIQAELYRQNNKLYYFTKPNPLQKDLLDAWANPRYKIFTFTGGNRIGKTTIGTIIAFSTMLGYFPWSNQRLNFNHGQPRKVRYVGQDWEKHIMQVVVPCLREWWPKEREYDTKKNNQGVPAMWTDKKTGSTLEIMSNNQESDLHEGWSGDLIVYDEPPRRDIRVANARGLIDRNGRELFCMTLLKEAWVHQEIINARMEDGKPDTSVYNINGDIFSNVGFGITQEGVEQFMKTLTEDEKSARIYGKPSYLSGLVYPQFKRNIHLVERFDIPLDWLVDIAIDIHPREKQAILFIATDPREDRYVFREIFEHGDGNFVGEQVVRVVARDKLRVNRIIVDPLAKGDKNMTNTTFDKIDGVLQAHGMVLDLATKDKQSGIIEVKKHLKGPNNKPSMFFFDDLRRTIWEIEGYMYDEEKQKPLDKDDHMMENLYRLCLLDTKWYPMDAFDDDYMDHSAQRTSNSWTGY